ncbi:hypothetical protein BDL97_02G064400 [Sphagnum fallax]|nr:hypothetical protein BDL97_02G064400 [Sphagnum fallax]
MSWSLASMSSSAGLLFNNTRARTTTAAVASKEYAEVATSMEVAAAGVCVETHLRFVVAAAAASGRLQRRSRRQYVVAHSSIVTPIVPFCRHKRLSSSSRCRAKSKVEARVVEEDGFESSADDAELPAKGLEKWIIPVEKAFNVLATEAVIMVLDAFYAQRAYARFYVLETIARVPYFAFVSVLHMYESFGWWRRADYLKVHFAESWNELHHLLTMEALGGDERWVDRFLAQHIAVAYYFMTVFMYLISPRMAYHFSECVEKHAFHSYDDFIKQHGEELKKLPAPEVAVKYYTEGDLYMFDEFQTDRLPNSRRPKVDNLYDVFVNIREDEAQHCKTMLACQTRGNLRSPHSLVQSTPPPKVIPDTELVQEKIVILPPAECAGIIECAITSSSFADRARKKGIEVKLDHLPS